MSNKERTMIDYDVWYKGRVIGNVKATSLLKAKNLADKIYQIGTDSIEVKECK